MNTTDVLATWRRFGFVPPTEMRDDYKFKTGQQEMTTLKEKKYFAKVAELGCAVCRRLGNEGTPAEIHHPRINVGMGQRSGNSGVIPLCPEHHRGSTGVHGLGRKAFAQLYGFSEQDLQADVIEQVSR